MMKEMRRIGVNILMVDNVGTALNDEWYDKNASPFEGHVLPLA
jgi:hypothetical protein